MANFLGFKQVKKNTFAAVEDSAKKNYMWLVRDEEKGTAAIYFGTRLYAEVNNNDAQVAAQVSDIIKSLGASVDEDGKFVGFLPIKEDAILADEKITSVSAALQALSKAIGEAKASAKEAKDAADKAQETADSAVTKADEAKVEIVKVKEDLSEKIDAIVEQVSGLTVESVSKDDFDTKVEEINKSISSNEKSIEEIKAAIVNVFHFKGTKTSKEELPEEGNEIGDVWHVSDESAAEYAWIDGKWESLGQIIDISGLATKEALEAEKSAREEADTAANKRIGSLEDKSTRIVTNYKEALETTGLTPGQIVYANESYIDPDDTGKTYGSGAYLVISVTPEGIPSFSKIEATTTGGQTPTDLINEVNSKVDAVDARVTTNEKSIETINSTLQTINTSHTITGDDVEE